MCGIAGIITPDKNVISNAHIISMGQSIGHRGPDDEGFSIVGDDGRVSSYSGRESRKEVKRSLPSLESAGAHSGVQAAFVHRRFSIIDMTPGGHQPLVDNSSGLILVFNGELYNYIELRSELCELGVHFYTQSDSEVVLKAYGQWGRACFSRFNGFWSLAIYNTVRDELILVRDRLGKKPLYYSQIGNSLYFASEMKALLRIQSIKNSRKLNQSAMNAWLQLGLKDFSAQTFFENILRVPPASMLTFASGKITAIDTWWSLPEKRYTESQFSVADASNELRKRLTKAVEYRLRADVPVGAELSGGMDSSVLTMLAAGIQPDIQAYTVRFPGKGFDEEPYARKVAEMYKLNYTVIEAPKTHIWGWIPQFTALEEEPYHSPNLMSNQAIWSKMRAAGIKVSINGASGDECFAGYYPHFMTYQNELFFRGAVFRFLKNAMQYNQTPWYKTLPKSLLRTTQVPKYAIRRIIQQMGHGEYRLLPEDIARPYTTLAEQLSADMLRNLMPYWLTSGDKASMGLPIEVRMPFLDCDVIDLAFKMPISYLIRNGWHKWILRETFKKALPEAVTWRRLKMGFPFPLKEFIDENQEILQIIQKMSDCPHCQINSATRYNWPAISFILWYEHFINENTALFEKIEEMAGEGEALPYRMSE